MYLPVSAGDISRCNLLELVNNFLRPSNGQWIAWRDYVSSIPSQKPSNSPPPPSAIYFAAHFGLVSTIEFLHSLGGVRCQQSGRPVGGQLCKLQVLRGTWRQLNCFFDAARTWTVEQASPEARRMRPC
jgi:hypothetical protein